MLLLRVRDAKHESRRAKQKNLIKDGHGQTVRGEENERETNTHTHTQQKIYALVTLLRSRYLIVDVVIVVIA